MRLLPKQEAFNTLFAEFAALLELAASDFDQAIQKNVITDETASLLLKREKEADQLGMKLFEVLHKSFVTPHDPEDLYALIHNLDDVMDGLEDTGHRICAYRVAPIPETMRKISALVLSTVKNIGPALDALDKNKNVVEACIAIKQKESEIDTLTRNAIADLFANERDAISLIKQKEVYEFFENTGDACAHVASIIGRIHIKGG